MSCSQCEEDVVTEARVAPVERLEPYMGEVPFPGESTT